MDDEQFDRDGWDEGASAFSWERRVMIIAAVWSMPGVLAGAFARLFVSDGGPAWWWMVGGGLLCAIAGGLMESDHWN